MQWEEYNWGEVTDTTDWSKNSVCEGTVTSLHIHSRLHLQFKDRKHKANTTEALRGKGWWFWGDPTSLFHAMDKCSFVLCPSAAGEHASSLDPRFPVCPQIQGLLPTLVHCPPAHPSLECREIRQVEMCSLRCAAGPGCAQDASKTYWDCQKKQIPWSCFQSGNS